MSRILLVRHGQSAHVHRAGWVDAAGMERWRASYDETGIAPDDPPPELMRELSSACHFVASDLPRAVESAEKLADGHPVIVSPLLREIPLAIPRLPLRLPVSAWGAAIGAAWGYRILTGTDTTAEDRARARTAARWLAGVGDGDSTVVAVTHGAFRRLLAQQLAAAGWRTGFERRSYRAWSVWTLRSRALPLG